MMSYPKKFMRNDLFKNIIQTQIVREDGIKKTSVVFQHQDGQGTPEFKKQAYKVRQRMMYTAQENNRATVKFKPEMVEAPSNYITPNRGNDDELFANHMQGQSIMPFAQMAGRKLQSQAGPRTVNVRQAQRMCTDGQPFRKVGRQFSNARDTARCIKFNIGCYGSSYYDISRSGIEADTSFEGEMLPEFIDPAYEQHFV